MQHTSTEPGPGPVTEHGDAAERTERGPLGRIDTVFVRTADLARAEVWYRDVLGLPVRFRADDIVAFDVDQTALTLLGPGSHDGSPTPADFPAFNFYAADAEATHAWLADRGVDVDPVQRADASFAEFTFRDPDGTLLQVCSFPE
ncbi:VOC family protein [Cellulosimicrobium sp. NPDC057127]|uniref:VOC family protein n=1 Tax=Cellulosimicrobium sp. NPDC057127 TaxID=3346026 RepID=UPI003628B9AE